MTVRRPGLTALLATALAASLVVAASAQAAVVEPSRVLVASPSNSVSPKSVTATCPEGKQVVGAGGDVGDGGGQVVFDDLTPSADLKSVTVKGVEDQNGLSHNWVVYALAVCAYPPAGLQRVGATSPLNSSNKTVTATCPSGKKVLGTGEDINAGNGQVGIDDMRPSADLKTVTVQGLEDQDGQSGPWNVTAYAICATPPSGLERVGATSDLDSESGKSALPSCPTGKAIIGTGSDINAGTGQVEQTGLGVSSDLSAFAASASEDGDGFANPWSITGYAICADRAYRADAITARNSSSPKATTATCQNGTTNSGLGGEITGGLGEVGMYGLFPDLSNGGALTAAEDETGTSRVWTARTYAICTSGLTGVGFHSFASSVGSPTSAISQDSCAQGQKLVGGAGTISAFGVSGQVLVNSITPFADLSGVIDIGYEDPNGTSESWAMNTYEFCADPPPGLQLVHASSPYSNEEINTATASCPTGKYLVGLGGGLNVIGGNGVIDDLRPDAALSKVTVTGVMSETPYDFSWAVDAYAICANI
jgi:hypothetical protein